MIIGYSRFSDKKQKQTLYEAGCKKIFTDNFCDKSHLLELKKMLQYAVIGDTIIVCRLDQLSSSIKELITTICLIKNKKINLKSLQDKIDTSSSVSDFFCIFNALSKFNYNVIVERISYARQIKKFRCRGCSGGRPKVLNTNKHKLLIKLYKEQKYSISQICGLMNISKPTLYKYIKKYSIN